MPGRSVGSDYAYGMNGQMKENAVFEGFMSADFWGYDSRLGRRWETDPIVKPWESPYMCFANNPIYYADPSGLDGENPDGSCPGDIQFPATPKDGQEYIHYDKANNANWGYVYDEAKKDWIATGASVTMNSITVEDKYTPTGLRKWGGEVSEFLMNSHFVFDVSGEANVGLGVGGKLKYYGQEVGVEANIAKMGLIKGHANLAEHTDNPEAYSWSYAGKDNVTEMSQGIEFTFSDYLKIGYEHTWDATNLMSDMNSGSKNHKSYPIFTIGKPLLENTDANEIVQDVIGNTLTNMGTIEVKMPVVGAPGSGLVPTGAGMAPEKTFIGLNLGAGAQVLLELKVNLKVGIEGD